MSNFGPDAFTVGANANLQVYNTAYTRIAGSGADNMVVDAASDRAEAKYSGSIGTELWASYRYAGAGAPLGDQEIRGVLRSEGGDGAYVGLMARRPTDNANTGYFFRVSDDGNGQIVRRVAGTDTVLASGMTLGLGVDYSAVARAIGIGATVDLSLAITGQTTVTYSDTNAARLVTGTPGLEAHQTAAASANSSQIDDFQIIDLGSPAIIPDYSAFPKQKICQQAS